MQIVDLTPDQDDRIRQCANLMVEGFGDHWPNYVPDLATATKEVHDTFGDEWISRVAVDGEAVLGFIGGNRQYNGYVWELHPLVVHAEHRGRGIGRALVADLEELVRARGATTLWLGSDDEALMTSAGGRSWKFTRDPNGHRLRDGTLADIAPTVLELLGLPVPEEMSGRTLLV